MGPCVVIERGRDPALRIMAVCAGCLSRFRKLACVGVLVTILTNWRRAFELYFFCARWDLVAIAALYGAMRAE